MILSQSDEFMKERREKRQEISQSGISKIWGESPAEVQSEKQETSEDDKKKKKKRKVSLQYLILS